DTTPSRWGGLNVAPSSAPHSGVERRLARGDALHDVGRIGLAELLGVDEGLEGAADEQAAAGVGRQLQPPRAPCRGARIR
ncbi:MAG: hypothetical protein U1E17_19115, partial [Geminicoccaceae bacterium]